MRIFTFVSMIVILAGSSNSYAADGKKSYDEKCKVCHAVDGTGNVGLAKAKKIDPALLDLTKPAVKKYSDLELLKIARDGKDTMKGIPADKLSDDELKAVISHVRTLQKTK